MDFFLSLSFVCLTAGIFSNGGTKPNIIPEEAELTYYIRAPTKGELEKLKAKVVACFHGAATSSGCTVRQHIMQYI